MTETLQNGAKTSEFWMAVAVILPYVANQLGIDLGAVAAMLIDAQKNIQAVHDTSQAPAGVAALYVAGRMWLKHRGIK